MLTLAFPFCITYCSKQTVEESDSDSEDEGIGLMFGGRSRHDLMMTDEKVILNKLC